MDRLSDQFPSEATERKAECPEHGPYLSARIIGKVWSRCPECQAALVRAEEAELSRKAAENAEARHRGMIAAACIPARFVGRTFDNFAASTDAQRHALTMAREFAESFAENARKGAGMIFAGKPGTGKSHLAAAILQSVLSPSVRYLTCMDLIRAVRETWRKDAEKSESQVLRYLEELDLLVIDEVGMQYGTDGEQTILFDVLDRRYREVKPIVILTNQDKAGFKGFVGDRTFDRLSETARWVPFDWESYRPTARKAA